MSDDIVCSECGSDQISVSAVCDYNTHEIISIDFEHNEFWCRECGNVCEIMTREEYDETQSANKNISRIE